VTNLLIPNSKAYYAPTQEWINAEGGTRLALVPVEGREEEKGLQFTIAATGTAESVHTILETTPTSKTQETTSVIAPNKDSEITHKETS
jgi:5,10-methylene-tetrahydrofolate dehydrogenase/methenyl tetrahydrofolate cyclohydrolase